MPKVLVASSSAYVLGGMERVMQRLGRDLGRHGYEVEVIIPNGDSAKNLQRWFDYQGTSATANDQIADVSRRKLRALFPLVDFFRTRKADLINLHSPGHHIPIAEVLAAKLANAATISSIHGFDPSGNHGVAEKIRNFAAGSPLNHKVVAPSKLVLRQQLQKHIAPEKLELIYYGVEVPSALPDRADMRRRKNISHDTFVIVSFGRLVPEKGIDTLIAAVNSLSDQHRRNLKVFIGGLGDHRRAYELQVGDADRNVIQFLGHVDDTGSYYAIADLFVLPSRHEPFGIVFVEAAQYGVPSIGTRVGGIPEAIEEGQTGLLVPQEDPKKLRDAIVLMMQDGELRAKFGEAAQKRAQHMFGVDTMVRAYARLYDSVLGIERASTIA